MSNSTNNNNNKINTELWQAIEKITGDIFSEFNNNNWKVLPELLCQRHQLIKVYFEDYSHTDEKINEFLENDNAVVKLIQDKKAIIMRQLTDMNLNVKGENIYNKIKDITE